MKLSTRTRYGMRAMLELAEEYGKGPLQIKVMAQNQDISIKYLEQLMTILKTSGFIRSIRGPRGGYLLAKDPGQVKLSEIFTALEGPLVTAECVEDKNYCARASDCVTRQLWTQVQNVIYNLLDSMTLKDLVKKTKDKKALYYQI